MSIIVPPEVPAQVPDAHHAVIVATTRGHHVWCADCDGIVDFLEPERRTYYPSRREAEVAALMHTAFGGE